MRYCSLVRCPVSRFRVWSIVDPRSAFQQLLRAWTASPALCHEALVFHSPSGSMNAPQKLKHLLNQLNTVIVGKPVQVRDCVACLLAGGHLLIEDVPGVGKTTLAHALAAALGLQFSRVQFTSRPDAERPVGRVGLRARQRDLCVSPGAGVRAGAAGRRDQPREPEDPERAARGDGRKTGHGRRGDKALAQPVFRHRHAKIRTTRSARSLCPSRSSIAF